ncbi:hypothetical protein DWV34_01180 [Anaerostipes sp. AF04-45]|nr:hypothetical protein HMPREF1011_00833 [Anaerostipes caccae]RGH25820.1 hypothetical protein DWV34_01180 [Anaerostipes sp. AF04-45]
MLKVRKSYISETASRKTGQNARKTVPEFLPAPACLQYVLCYRQSIFKKRGLSIYEKLCLHYNNFSFKNNI